MITGKGPSARHETSISRRSNLAAVRIDDFKYQFITQPRGWIGAKEHPDMPILTNLRLEPVRTNGVAGGSADGNLGSYSYFEWFRLSSGASCLSSRKLESWPDRYRVPAHAKGRKTSTSMR